MPEPNKRLGSNPDPATYCPRQAVYCCVSAFSFIRQGGLPELSQGAAVRVGTDKSNSLEQCLLNSSTVTSHDCSHKRVALSRLYGHSMVMDRWTSVRRLRLYWIVGKLGRKAKTPETNLKGKNELHFI